MPKPYVRIPATFRDRSQGIDLAQAYYNPPGVNGLARRLFGKTGLLIRRHVMLAAFEKDPYSGITAIDHEGHAVGFYEAWAITDRKLDNLIRGRIRDDELGIDDFHSISETHNKLYVGMTVPIERADGRRLSGEFAKECLRTLIFAACQLYYVVYLPRERANGRLQVYALSETHHGQELAERLGYQIDTRCYERPDGKAVYHREATKDWVDQVRAEYNLSPDQFDIRESWPKGTKAHRSRPQAGKLGIMRA